jgi:hypothetical protein
VRDNNNNNIIAMYTLLFYFLPGKARLKVLLVPRAPHLHAPE